MENDVDIQFFARYDLNRARKQAPKKPLRAHQQRAINELDKWFSERDFPRGGLLVLPTGAGKTYTAVHFIFNHVIPEGYKVLWLAHTHHLLEQAFYSFSFDLGSIPEPKECLRVRVVSGTPGHDEPRDIKPNDDVIIATLQTATRAYATSQPQFVEYLNSVDKLFVVFDEAHHSPAPSYRKFILSLRERFPSMYLLGMTATPYAEEEKSGWFKELFPQDILAYATVEDLMAAHILAKPIFEEARTKFTPVFDERDYRKWKHTYGDLPESIISELASNRERNEFIANSYIGQRERYGKTIIFADRWYQCDYLREHLNDNGIKADVVYSHVDADPGSAEARNKRDKSENARVLERFRNNELDVLINVRMLTEGTDVPNVNTVFLTRQTTSQILITQMVGRALRGPDFDGTDVAFIVSFIDNWKRLINWGRPELIQGGIEEDGKRGPYKPLDLISIDLVRQLAKAMQAMERGETSILPFLTLLPVGWYKTDFTTLTLDDEAQRTSRLILVFEDTQNAYKRLINGLKTADLEAFDERATLERELNQLDIWHQRYFSEVKDSITGAIIPNIFDIARHVAQNDGAEPVFFEFEERKNHDLDALVAKFVDEDLGPRSKKVELLREYNREDRYWNVIYYSFEQFWNQYHVCEYRYTESGDTTSEDTDIPSEKPRRKREFLEEEKEQIKRRDGNECLCCGNTHRLQIDHIVPWYMGGPTTLSNAQTLCSKCHAIKKNETVDFRRNTSMLSGPPESFPPLSQMRLSDVYGSHHDVEEWEELLRRSINFFYRCSAVASVTIGMKRTRFYNWEIELYEGNDTSWLRPYLDDIKAQINEARKRLDMKELESIKLVNNRTNNTDH